MNEIKLNLKSLSLFSFSFWSQKIPLVVHQLRCVCSLQNNYFFCPHFVALFYLSLQRVKRLELDQLNTFCSLKYYLCSTSIHYVLSKHRFGIEINVMNYRVRVPLHYLDSFFVSSAALINSQLDCLRPVYILNDDMFSLNYLFQLFARILNDDMFSLNYLFQLFARPHQHLCYNTAEGK